jgi:formylglycine-generating enzyme required for sulfatase activity
MILISAGTNQVNDPDFGGYDLVIGQPLCMDITEISLGKWQEVYGWAVSHGYSFATNTATGLATNHPVVSVNWFDCAKWCNARSEMEGRIPVYRVSGSVYRNSDIEADTDYSADGYRLPTLEEWEYAARGGHSEYLYPWGNSISSSNARYGSSSTAVCGSYPANEYGLYDIVGNVWEWCNEESVSGERARSGGGYSSTTEHLRCGYPRDVNAGGPIEQIWGGLGFRTVCKPHPITIE